MKKSIFCLLPFLLFVVGAMVSCEEVEEAGEYDNWRERNEAFIDSIRRETGEVYVATPDDHHQLEEGQLFAIRDFFSSTNKNDYYIYCKKIKGLDDYTHARRPLFTETASVYYYGTLINGVSFDGNFSGYGAADQGFLDKDDEEKAPTDFDSPNEFAINGSLINGWRIVLQYMYVGERWMVYIPWQSAYGSSSTGSIPGYSALAFDIRLEDVVDDED